jgi:hypothetical protein
VKKSWVGVRKGGDGVRQESSWREWVRFTRKLNWNKFLVEYKDLERLVYIWIKHAKYTHRMNLHIYAIYVHIINDLTRIVLNYFSFLFIVEYETQSTTNMKIVEVVPHWKHASKLACAFHRQKREREERERERERGRESKAKEKLINLLKVRSCFVFHTIEAK